MNNLFLLQGTTKTFRSRYFYKFPGNKTTCVKIKGVFKLFDKNDKDDKNPVLIHGFRGSKITC